MLSPVFRVRDFHMTDISHYPVKVHWNASPTDPDDDTELLVFPQGNTIPSTKVLLFYRKEPFDIEPVYAQPDLLPGSIYSWIGKFTAKEVPVSPNGDATCVKLRARLNLHGIMSFESAYVEEVEEREEPAPAPMDVDGFADNADQAPTPPPKKKGVVKKKEIPVVATNSSLDKSIVESYRELESQINATDKLVMDTEVNNLFFFFLFLVLPY
jgi:heat shock protein 4